VLDVVSPRGPLIGRYSVPLSLEGTFQAGPVPRDLLAGTQPLRAYVDAGGSFHVNGSGTAGDSGAGFNCSLSGYFVDAP
jgi:hypothetical protein